MADPVPADAADEEIAEGQAIVDLPAGDELNAADTEEITVGWPTQLIVFAGAEDSGKTTMIAALYEHLGQGPFAGFEFAGSRSMLGFEKICHANRLASGSERPNTERTIPSGEAAYYHLALRESDGERRRRQLLLSAVSGELFKWARDSREECEKLTFLKRANAIIILVDGEKLACLEQRENARADAADILDAFLDARMVPIGSHVEFVFSKLDRIRAAGDSAYAFLEQTKQKLTIKFRDRVPQLVFRELAARPRPSDEVEELSKGLEESFATWAVPQACVTVDIERLVQPPSDAREFDKFGWRRADDWWRAAL